MASELVNEEFIFSNRPSDQSEIKSTWRLQSCPIPIITNNNEFIVKALFVSVDPYLSSGTINEIGSVQISGLVGLVIESKNTKIPVDTLVMGRMVWRRFILANGTEPRFRILKNQPRTVQSMIE